jgi:hypothetical protein
LSTIQFRMEHWQSIRTLMYFALKTPRERPTSVLLCTTSLFGFFISFHRDYRLNGFISSVWGVTFGTVLTVGIKILNAMLGVEDLNSPSSQPGYFSYFLPSFLCPGVVFSNAYLPGFLILLPQFLKSSRQKNLRGLPWGLYSARLQQGLVELICFDYLRMAGPKSVDPYSPYLFQFLGMYCLDWYFREYQSHFQENRNHEPDLKIE